jgi:cellobiose phosphorylase
MRYGYFDDERKEYVIERPDTPRSWSNYLGSTRYGAIITNNAGGYSFFHSAAQGRFMRLRFNSVPLDQPGRYIYIHDRDKKDYWSASWQPVGKPLSEYKTECRHGSAYTIITSRYCGIETQTTYFVPLDRDFECWHLKITNQDKHSRKLRLFTFVEYACNWNVTDDLNNLQYVQYISKMKFLDGMIDHGSNVNLPEMPDQFEEKDQGRHTFLAVAGAQVTGFDTDRDVFLGSSYRTYANPQIVEKGQCLNSLASGGNPCGTLQIDMDLEPGQSKEMIVLMGIGTAQVEGKKAVQEYSDPGKVSREFERLKKHWHSRLTNFNVQTPDPQVNTMLNMWSPYNSLITYFWSRAASLIYSGERDGLGYRDSVQDMLGVLHNIHHEVRERLELMITGQVSSGGAMPVVKPFAHKPGCEKSPAENQFRSDDCLWLFNTVPAYVKETGDLGFYQKSLPYADKGEDTVLGHLKRAMEFNINRSGAHGLPCGLLADWNDCIKLGHNGESVFVAFQLRYALKTYREICEQLGIPEEVQWAQKHLETLDKNLQDHTWDGRWYLRAYREDGFKFGSKENPEGKIFLNPQAWAVYSGHADKKHAIEAMDAVKEHLSTAYGLMICDPPYAKTDFNVMRAVLMNSGMKENGGIFNHIQGWAIIAEAMLGRGERAFEYYKAYLPAVHNDNAEIRKTEPYVYCQSTHSKYSPHFGMSALPWLSGTAAWAYYAVTQYILGIQPDYHGLKINPCIPSDWDGFSVRRVFRDAVYHITVQNPEHVSAGIREIRIDGKRADHNLIPVFKAGSEHRIEVIMGNCRNCSNGPDTETQGKKC